jgi:hypothetical protein
MFSDVAKPLTSDMVQFYSSYIMQQHLSNAYFALFFATLFHFHSWLLQRRQQKALKENIIMSNSDAAQIEWPVG